jgi:hypothetical protein
MGEARWSWEVFYLCDLWGLSQASLQGRNSGVGAGLLVVRLVEIVDTF